MKRSPSNCKVARLQSREAGLRFLPFPIVSESPRAGIGIGIGTGTGTSQHSCVAGKGQLVPPKPPCRRGL